MADEPIIGSIGVAVVPNAEKFWEDFKAKTRAGAEEGIQVKVRADTTPAEEDIAALKARAKIGDTDVKVRADTNEAQQSVGLLGTAIVGLGAAAIPVAGVVAGAFAGAIPTVLTLALGVKGMQDAFKDGAYQGTLLGNQIGYAQANLKQLEQTAAGGVYAGFNSALRQINAQMPQVNREVGAFATQIGGIASHAAPALVTLFTQMTPLFQTFGNDIERGAAAFQHWAQTSGAVGKFVAYVQTNLPNVEQTIQNLVETGSHVVMAFAPFGSTTLTALRLFSQAINAIPVPVLQTLVPLLAGAFLGSRLSTGITNISVGLTSMATRMSTAGAVAQGVAPAVGGLGKAVGYLGPIGLAAGVALGGLSLIMGQHQKQAIADAEAVNRLTQAIEAGTGAAQVMQELTKTGAVSAAGVLGVNPQELVQVITQQGDAADKLSRQIATLRNQQQDSQAISEGAANAYAKLSQGYTLTADEARKYGTSLTAVKQAQIDAQNQSDNLNGRLRDLQGSVAEVSRQYEQAKQKAADFAAQQGDAALGSAVLSGRIADQARALGVTTDAYYAAKLAADKSTASVKKQTLEYQMENDAANILKGTLDRLNGKQLDAADALNAFQSSLVNFNTGGTLGVGPTQSQQTAATTAASRQQIATEALAQAQARYNAAVKSGKDNAQQLAALHLALERAQLAVTTSTNATEAATAKLAGTSGKAAGTINGMDSASVQLRGELNNQIRLLEQLVEADGGWQNSTAKSRAEMAALRQQIIDNAVAHGVDRKAVTDYINTLFKIPTTIPPTQLDVDNSRALRKIDQVRHALLTLQGTTVTQIQFNGNLGPVAEAHGAVLDFTNRAASVQHFADGGHVAQIAPAGSMRLWAEPETGGEAYIPLAASKRQRSEAILSTVADRFGGTYSHGTSSAPLVAGDYIQNIYNPVREPASTSAVIGAKRAVASLGRR